MSRASCWKPSIFTHAEALALWPLMRCSWEPRFCDVFNCMPVCAVGSECCSRALRRQWHAGTCLDRGAVVFLLHVILAASASPHHQDAFSVLEAKGEQAQWRRRRLMTSIILLPLLLLLLLLFLLLLLLLLRDGDCHCNCHCSHDHPFYSYYSYS